MTEQYSWKNEERCPILKDVELNGKSVYTSPGSEKDFSSFIKFKIDLTKSVPRRISNHIITSTWTTLQLTTTMNSSYPSSTSSSLDCVRTRTLPRNMTRHIDDNRRRVNSWTEEAVSSDLVLSPRRVSVCYDMNLVIT